MSETHVVSLWNVAFFSGIQAIYMYHYKHGIVTYVHFIDATLCDGVHNFIMSEKFSCFERLKGSKRRDVSLPWITLAKRKRIFKSHMNKFGTV